jgi:hypothetical protein
MCKLEEKTLMNLNFSVPEYDPMDAYDMSIQAGSLSSPYSLPMLQIIQLFANLFSFDDLRGLKSSKSPIICAFYPLRFFDERKCRILEEKT